MVFHGGTIVVIDDKRNYPSEEEYFVLLYEFKHGLESYLKTAFEKKKSLQELIDFNNANSEKVMRLFGQEIFYAAIEASSNKDKYLESLEILKASTKETILLMDRYK